MASGELPPLNFESKTYNGISIIVETNSGYINASRMCSDNGKKWRNYKQTNQWKEIEKAAVKYIKFDEKIGAPYLRRTQIDVINAENEYKGTYIHPKLIHFVAEWVSVEYAFKVAELMDSINEKVHEELTKSNLSDTPENAKPIFNQTVQNIKSSNVSELENQQCWGVRERNKYDYLDSYDKSDIRNLWLKIKEFGKNIMNDYPELFQ